MATITESTETAVNPESLLPADWYDRSSMVGDCMVMIADQSVDDYIRRCPEGRTCEYIDGVVYMPAAVDARHQFNIQALVVLLELFTYERQSGIVLTGPTAFRLLPERYLEPDLFVLPAGGEAQVRGWYSVPPALLVVEALSPSTRTHDLGRKFAIYREAAVPEIWFIDDRDKVVLVDRWTPEGYVTERLETGQVISRSIPGFWFETQWLWEKRPNLLRCFEQILAGPPS